MAACSAAWAEERFALAASRLDSSGRHLGLRGAVLQATQAVLGRGQRRLGALHRLVGGGEFRLARTVQQVLLIVGGLVQSGLSTGHGLVRVGDVGGGGGALYLLETDAGRGQVCLGAGQSVLQVIGFQAGQLLAGLHLVAQGHVD